MPKFNLKHFEIWRLTNMDEWLMQTWDSNRLFHCDLYQFKLGKEHVQHFLSSSDQQLLYLGVLVCVSVWMPSRPPCSDALSNPGSNSMCWVAFLGRALELPLTPFLPLQVCVFMPMWVHVCIESEVKKIKENEKYIELKWHVSKWCGITPVC